MSSNLPGFDPLDPGEIAGLATVNVFVFMFSLFFGVQA